MKIGLIHVIILGSNVKLVRLIFWKLHHVDGCVNLPLVSCSLLVEQEEADLRVAKLAEVPKAHLSVDGDGNDIMGILRTYDCQRMDWLVVAIFGQRASLDWCLLFFDVPLHDIS